MVSLSTRPLQCQYLQLHASVILGVSILHPSESLSFNPIPQNIPPIIPSQHSQLALLSRISSNHSSKHLLPMLHLIQQCNTFNSLPIIPSPQLNQRICGPGRDILMDKMACLGDHHKLVFSCRQTRNTNGGAKEGSVGIMEGGLVEGEEAL